MSVVNVQLDRELDEQLKRLYPYLTSTTARIHCAAHDLIVLRSGASATQPLQSPADAPPDSPSSPPVVDGAASCRPVRGGVA